MKACFGALVLFVLTISFAAMAIETPVYFAANTPYTRSEKKLLAESLQKYCPRLVDTHTRAEFSEVKTTVQKRKRDQQMFDTVYTTLLHFETNEAGRYEGTVVMMGEKNYDGDEITSFSVISDSENICWYSNPTKFN